VERNTLMFSFFNFFIFSFFFHFCFLSSRTHSLFFSLSIAIGVLARISLSLTESTFSDPSLTSFYSLYSPSAISLSLPGSLSVVVGVRTGRMWWCWILVSKLIYIVFCYPDIGIRSLLRC
jgi:hypothetical protein